MRMGPLLDIAANSQEELKEWTFKIREVAVTSEAKVNTTISPVAGSWEHTVRRLSTVELQSRLQVAEGRKTRLAVNCVNTK